MAVYLLLLKARPATTFGVITTFAGVGLMVAFWLNMRTSQAPMSLAMFTAFGAAWRRPHGLDDQTVGPRKMALALAVFALTVVTAHLALVRAVDQPGAAGVSHHLIAHPLVLALADPASPLSQREGIQWDDASGLKLARRLEPGVEYLSAEYDRTLGRYYFKLWKTHTSEMLGIYVAKIRQAGSGVLEQAAIALEHRWVPAGVSAWLGRRTLSGVTLIVLAAATWGGGWWLFRRTSSLVAFGWVLLSISALSTLLESAMIVSRFYIFYHGILLLYVLTLPLALAQLALDGFRSRGIADAPLIHG